MFLVLYYGWDSSLLSNSSFGMSLCTLVCHYVQWYVIMYIGMSLCTLVCHYVHWYVIMYIGMSLCTLVCHYVHWYGIILAVIDIYSKLICKIMLIPGHQ